MTASATFVFLSLAVLTLGGARLHEDPWQPPIPHGALLGVAVPGGHDRPPGRLWSGTPVDTTARAAAEAWLPLVDRGEYEESWRRSSAFFRETFSLEQWDQAVRSAREPLGALESRSLADVTEESSIPGAPPGDYVVLRYQSRFANWPTVHEVVVLMREDDRTWGVVGYFASGG